MALTRESICPKVLARIECVSCWYPHSEARYDSSTILTHKEKCDICGKISIDVVNTRNGGFLCTNHWVSN